MEKFSSFDQEAVGNEETAKEKTSLEKSSLYPERVSDSYAEVIQDIQRMETDESLKQSLDDFEKQALFDYEGPMADRLENIFAIKTPTATFYPDYLTTAAGKELWRELLGEDVPDDLSDPREFFYHHLDKFAALGKTERVQLSYASEKYVDERVKADLKESLDEVNSFSAAGVDSPELVKFIINPDQAALKNRELRTLKGEVKEVLKGLPESDDNLTSAKRSMLAMYSRRINELIASGQSHAVVIQKKLNTLGLEAMSPAELEILKDYSLSEETDLEKRTSRFDKFKYGAAKEYNADGYRQQISEELLAYATSIDVERSFIELSKDSLLAAKGLDKEKITAMDITPEQRKEWGDRVLAAYDLLAGDTNNAEGTGSGWQYLNKSRNTMAVKAKRREVYDTQKMDNVSHALPVALAHEIEGHVLQAVNKEVVPLRLFQTVGGGRSMVFAEGGAMHNQNLISKELFGYESLPGPHYVRAMATKLSGGNYVECVKTFYESAIDSVRQDFEKGEIDKVEFDARADEQLSLAINRTRRLFRDGEPNSIKDFLSSSKDTAYLEQKKVLDGLEQAGLFKLAYIGGVNLENARELIRFGLLDLSKIKEPQFETLKIWEEIKSNYLK